MKDRMMPSLNTRASIAVLVPCYNEEKTIANVVRDFRRALPTAAIYVYDNNSSDATRKVAAETGEAEVRSEPLQGKGWVVRRMFADIEADIYVLVDGDDTYEAAKASQMVEMLRQQQLAMVVGRRAHEAAEAYRPGHVLGNKMFTGAVATLFGTSFTDILSGYRVFSRPFVKSFPVFAGGFEIETELTVHALTLKLPVAEVETVYKERPAGSVSKLSTYRDGIRILWMILLLFKNEKPFLFFSLLGGLFLLAAIALSYPVVVTFLETGLVPRVPTAVLATGMAVYALIMFACGLILDTVSKGRQEAKMLSYLNAGKR
jgi:glycosyltransferase involved in cell wall biosynthesis